MMWSKVNFLLYRGFFQVFVISFGGVVGFHIMMVSIDRPQNLMLEPKKTVLCITRFFSFFLFSRYIYIKGFIDLSC